MDKGWVKLHRKIEENVLLNTDNNAYILFTKLLMYVNSKGQYTTGRFALADRCNLKPMTVYRTLQKLEGEQLVTLKTNNRYTLISICNWSKYQATVNSDLNNRRTTSVQPANNGRTLNKNKNKELEKGDSHKMGTATAETRARIRAQLQEKGILK